MDMANTHQAERASVGLVPFEVTSFTGAADAVLKAVDAKQPMPVRLSNAYCVALASQDKSYERLLNEPGLNFPDGAPVVWFMRARAGLSRRPRRVRGPSLFHEVLDRGRTTAVRHFFLGTTESTLASLQGEINARFPGTIVAGHHAPPYGPLSESFLDECARQVQASNANLVWVALGTPKQDFVASYLAEKLRMPAIGIGAAFDFTAGTAKEAPLFIQRSGLEWAFRLATEPRRLWRRYLFGNVSFFISAIRHHRSKR